ncbi:TPA: hypothetical protein ACP4LD_004691 [Escherichia coli]
MSRINKQLNESNSTIYTPAFVESISKVDIPAGIYLKSADYFDDKYINSTSDSWVFDYSGSRCYAHFRRDKISNQLTKYICFRYASAKCPAQIPGVLHAWSLATDHCITQSAFTFRVLKDYLETQEIDPRYFYYIIFGLKILCAEAFPGFTLDDYEDLEFIPRPHSHDWDIYQEIDHVLDPLEKSMISKGLFEMATSIRYGENYSLNTIRDAAILGLTYVTGARPAQLAKLATKDLRIDIRYVGVKGAGERTHWVEPLAAPLVESIFSSVKILTAPIRSHLTYLRAKSFTDYLPQAISALPGERVELDDVVTYITQTTSSFRGRAGQRDKTSKALSKRGVLPVQEMPGPKNSKSIYYSKTDLNHYIKTEFGLTNANEPCTHAWMENGKRYEVNYEDLLFLHEKGSLALKRTLALLAIPIPFTNTLMNKFLGNVEPDGSVFSKYQLLEENGTPTRMRTHIPRHNINTFLAIADIADHLQAMLMGRVDITQNQHYQHLALAERRKAASLVPLQPISTALTAAPSSSSVATPLEIVKRTGQLAVTEHMTLDNTIKANLHTFDDRDDVARFVEASFADGLFEDVAAAFEEIRDAEGPEQASAMVARHAVMYPLKFGSCMREVNLWGCPYRLKCQSAAFCEHFMLTGRIDELPNLIAKKQALQQAHSKLTQLTQHQPDYQTRLADIERRLQQLEAKQAQWQRRAKTQQLVAAESVLSGGVITEGKVRTLAQLFALEYQQLMQEND